MFKYVTLFTKFSVCSKFVFKKKINAFFVVLGILPGNLKPDLRNNNDFLVQCKIIYVIHVIFCKQGGLNTKLCLIDGCWLCIDSLYQKHLKLTGQQG